jgi:hypothetical protein
MRTPLTLLVDLLFVAGVIVAAPFLLAFLLWRATREPTKQ